jgi:ubiquinone biosynthesis protein
LTSEDRARLTRLFVDAATENVDALPRRLSDLGVEYERDREDELRSRLEELYYRYYGTRLSEIDPIEVMREAFTLIYAMNLRLPTRFVILDKVIATLGSVGIEIYPEFNVFEVARPYAKQLIAERLSPSRLALEAQREVRELAGVARELPHQVHDMAETVRRGRFEMTVHNPGVDHLEERLDHAVNRMVVGLIVAAGLLGSAIVGVGTDGPKLLGVQVLAFLGFIISGVFGIWLIWGVLRSGRL